MAARVVLVSEAFHPDPAGSAATAAAVARGLARHHPVLVLTGQPDFTAGGTQAPAEEVWQGVRIHRSRTWGLDKNSVVGRSLRATAVAATMGTAVARHVGRDDVVMVVLSPGWLPLVAIEAARRRGAKVVLLAWDLFPDSLVPAGVMRADAAAFRAMGALFHRLYRQVDATVVLGRCMAARVAEIGGAGAAPVHVIRHWADLDVVAPTPPGQATLREELGLQGRFVFEFAGNLGRVQGLDTVARAMALLGDDPRIVTLFLGSGAGEATLRRVVADHRLSNVIFAPMRPRSEQSYFLGAADVGLVTLAGGMAGLGVPGKTPNVLAAGKPVLAMMEPGAETARLVVEEGVGWAVPPDDAAAVAASMRAIAADVAGVAARAARCRAVAERVFSYEAMVEAYAGVVAEVLGR